MGAYLVDHPPARQQFLCPRRSEPSGVIVVHTAENTPDYVAFDGGAEAVARFIADRTDKAGSYHDLCDSDSTIQLVEYRCEAFHDGTGTNRHSYGVSAATRADVWPLAPDAWRQGCVAQMAAACRRYSNWLRAQGLPAVPARRVSAAEARAGIPGFVSHAELDPTRRSDPGKGFPWTDFLAQYRLAVPSVPTPNPSPTQGGTVNVNVRVLREGHKGGDVRSLQALLNAKAGKRLTVDGAFGPRTRTAVVELQRFFHLPVDGVVGARTWPCLFL